MRRRLPMSRVSDAIRAVFAVWRAESVKGERTVLYLGTEVDDALEMAERIES